ncbi:phage virion morphogenesis protein [Guyparkeria halophila]|uniref:Phage virion morphogenesis protein n=1 Tax=Guyparkeria halophila TaxID=47960 RepID=A0ABZ0YVS6_9GAMM|nr:phage virion morphogenesis protein [Guyparkeria halophila]WQH16146.1 phage virion morphogenesis protein [Guyparkeria halophila]
MIEIDYKDRSVLNALQRLDDRLTNLTPAMRDIAGVLTDATERAFQDEADPATGTPWAPLTEATVGMRGGDAHPILQRSGQLAASVTGDWGPDHAVAGTNKVYAAMQQFGGITKANSMIPYKEIPARPFLGIGDEDKNEILDIVRSYLDPTA